MQQDDRQQKKLFGEPRGDNYRHSPTWKRKQLKKLPLPKARGVSRKAMLLVLDAILEACGTRRDCSLRREAIADESGLQVRQVARALKALSGAGVITIKHQSRKRDGHRAASRYAIPGITAPAGSGPGPGRGQPKSSGAAASAGTPGADPKGQNVPLARGQNVPRPKGQNVPALRSFLSCSNSKDPPPPTSSFERRKYGIAGESPPEAQAARWVVVGRVLFEEIGIQDYRTVLEAAAQRGCTPEFVESLIEFYRSKPGAWQPGGLHDRILNAWPDQDPTMHWLPPRGEYSQRQQKLAERQQKIAELARRLDQDIEAKARRDREAVAFEEARARLGPLSIEELRQLADRTSEAIRPHCRRAVEAGTVLTEASPLVRTALLHAQARAAALDPVPPAGKGETSDAT